MKKLKIIGTVLFLIILFRGMIYRTMFAYVRIGERDKIQITNQILIEQINKNSLKEEMTIDEIIKIARKLTCENLSFTSNQTSNNPNELINTKQANCIGYSSMFNTVGIEMLKLHKLDNNYRINHLIGRIEFMGINIHDYFEDDLFRDHDYNEIIEVETGEKKYVDPSLSDYFWIGEVSSDN